MSIHSIHFQGKMSKICGYCLCPGAMVYAVSEGTEEPGPSSKFNKVVS